MTRPWRCVDKHAVFGGVCGGLAYKVGIPSWIIRLLFFIITFVPSGFGILLYAVLCLIIPNWKTDPEDYLERTGD